MVARWLRRLEARGSLPRISESERIALEAGDVWADAEIFSGRPDLARLVAEPYPELRPEERAFLEGPVEEICRRVDDWELWRVRELPEEAWGVLRRAGFFGLRIPRAYGGKGFSALGASAILGKLASHSLSLAVVVLIPNSVGPAELLLEYGTEEQKDYYLPRLARGEEIPCFALTEPEAGSDAAALSSEGVLFRRDDGRLLLRLRWEKRYITLAPIATLIGLAFRLRDPENLLGRGEDLGITLALVPASLPGIDNGRRHDPMGAPFPNGPTSGRGVIVSVEQIVGGLAGAGRGWRMLVETLAAGRALSLPAIATGGAKAAARIAGAYAAVRRQFGLPLARFEGVQEPLARIGGWIYAMDAARVWTCGAVDGGHRPAVVAGTVKYQTTELARRIAADAMDVVAGAGVCWGPRNPLGRGWATAPIGITVEGANILTRTLIVFGQGLLRCHPCARRELEAAARGDTAALARALVAHALAFARNAARGALFALTRGRLARAPVRGRPALLWRRLAWSATRFAVLADLALLVEGGRLKRRGSLSGRFSDALSWIFLGLASLRRFEAEGRREEDRPLAEWAAGRALAEAQRAFEGIAANFPGRLLRPLLRGPAALWLRLTPVGRPPSDRLGSEVAAVLCRPGAARDRLTAGIYLGTEPDDPSAVLERALETVHATASIRERLRAAVARGHLPDASLESLIAPAVAAAILTAEEGRLLGEAELARRAALEVDSFSLAEYLGERRPTAPDGAAFSGATAGPGARAREAVRRILELEGSGLWHGDLSEMRDDSPRGERG